MTGYERAYRLLRHQEADRVAVFDSYWQETIQRWQSEGLAEGTDLGKEFGHDVALFGFDMTLGFPEEVLGEDERTVTVRGAYGMTERRWKSQSGPPQMLGTVIGDRASWDEHKHRLEPSERRMPRGSADAFRSCFEDKGRFCCFSALDPYEHAWRYFGVENLLIAMAAEPDLAAEVFDTSAELILAMARRYDELGIELHGCWLWGDIAYRNAPLFSPDAYRRLLQPAHKKIYDHFRSRDLPCVYHTDGDIRVLIPDLMEAGVTCLHPLEAKAGLDVRKLKGEYGDDLAFFGNIDIRVMGGTREEIEEEVRSKLSVAKVGGGYLYHSDHSVPPSVSLDNYRFVLEMVGVYGRY